MFIIVFALNFHKISARCNTKSLNVFSQSLSLIPSLCVSLSLLIIFFYSDQCYDPSKPTLTPINTWFFNSFVRLAYGSIQYPIRSNYVLINGKVCRFGATFKFDCLDLHFVNSCSHAHSHVHCVCLCNRQILRYKGKQRILPSNITVGFWCVPAQRIQSSWESGHTQFMCSVVVVVFLFLSWFDGFLAFNSPNNQHTPNKWFETSKNGHTLWSGVNCSPNKSWRFELKNRIFLFVCDTERKIKQEEKQDREKNSSMTNSRTFHQMKFTGKCSSECVFASNSTNCYAFTHPETIIQNSKCLPLLFRRLYLLRLFVFSSHSQPYIFH